MSEAKYILRFFFDGVGCLWPGNEAAYRDFDLGPYDVLDPCPLPLSSRTVQKCLEMAAWHDSSFNREYPPDPGTWRRDECDRFNLQTQKLLTDIRSELGSAFQVIDQQSQAVEDPELNAYLIDPKGFRRKQA